jgi:hypothetical protein
MISKVFQREIKVLSMFFPLHHYFDAITCKYLKYSQLKKHKYSLGAKGSHFYVRKNIEKSLSPAFCSPQLIKFIDLDPEPHQKIFLPGSGSEKKTNADPQHWLR